MWSSMLRPRHGPSWPTLHKMDRVWRVSWVFGYVGMPCALPGSLCFGYLHAMHAGMVAWEWSVYAWRCCWQFSALGIVGLTFWIARIMRCMACQQCLVECMQLESGSFGRCFLRLNRYLACTCGLRMACGRCTACTCAQLRL